MLSTTTLNNNTNADTHTATGAFYHYGNSMVEYPGGSLLAVKKVEDPRLLLNGENYVIETDEYTITRKIYNDGDSVLAYSTNKETHPDGHPVYGPIRIPKDAIRHLYLVLGNVSRRI